MASRRVWQIAPRIPKEVAQEAQAKMKGFEDPQLGLATWEEVWTGDYIFENEWQSFRSKKDRSLEMTSVFRECASARRNDMTRGTTGQSDFRMRCTI